MLYVPRTARKPNTARQRIARQDMSHVNHSQAKSTTRPESRAAVYNHRQTSTQATTPLGAKRPKDSPPQPALSRALASETTSSVHPSPHYVWAKLSLHAEICSKPPPEKSATKNGHAAIDHPPRSAIPPPPGAMSTQTYSTRPAERPLAAPDAPHQRTPNGQSRYLQRLSQLSPVSAPVAGTARGTLHTHALAAVES